MGREVFGQHLELGVGCVARCAISGESYWLRKAAADIVRILNQRHSYGVSGQKFFMPAGSCGLPCEIQLSLDTVKTCAGAHLPILTLRINCLNCCLCWGG